jgi:hypothetical protein
VTAVGNTPFDDIEVARHALAGAGYTTAQTAHSAKS